MGAGSFGSIMNTGAAMIMLNSSRRGYGGYDNEEPEKKKSRTLKNFLIFLCSFSFFCAASIFVYGLSDWSHYTRPGQITTMHKGSHEYKGRTEIDYFFIVQWLDQEKETEGFEVNSETFRAHKTGDRVYFKRRLPEAKWLDSLWGIMLGMGGISVFLFSLMYLGINEFE